MRPRKLLHKELLVSILLFFIVISVSLNVYFIKGKYFIGISFTDIADSAELVGILGVIFPIIVYYYSQQNSRADYTMHVVSSMQKDIINQNKLINEILKNRKSIIDEIINNAVSMYISKYYNDKLLSLNHINNIREEISNRLLISNKDLQFNAKLRVIGFSITRLNRWAAYINKKGMDFNKNLLYGQISGMVLRFLNRYQDVYDIMKRNKVPLKDLIKLQNILKNHKWKNLMWDE